MKPYLILILSLFVGILSLPGCSTQTAHRDSSLAQNADNLKILKYKAMNGDDEAAWIVFQHYALGIRNVAEAEKWLGIAAKHGNAKAKRYMEIRSKQSIQQ